MEDPKYTFKKIVKCKKLRTEYYLLYNRLIEDLVHYEFFEAAAIHARKLASIVDEVNLLAK